MKNLLLSMLFLMIVCYTQQVMAQNSDISDRVKQMTEKQTEQLSLTPEQVPHVEAVNLDFITGMQQAKDGSGSKISKFKSFKKLDETRTKSMKAILTAEQFKTFESVKKEIEKN